MKYLVLFVLFLTRLLLSNSVFEDENPVLFHHVNVMSGQLNLSFQDIAVEGALPLQISRTYTSSGSLESPALKDWILGGGWTLFPHTRMVYVRDAIKKHLHDRIKVYLPEKGGSIIKYIAEKETDHHVFFHAEPTARGSGSLGARHDPSKNRIEVNTRDKKARLYAADGSVRYYSLDYWGESVSHFLLDYEILPSKHRIAYSYKKGTLSDVFLQNPDGTKTLASAHFDTNGDQVTIDTSDGKSITYKLMRYKNRSYLEEVVSNCRPHEKYNYNQGRRHIGARITGMTKGPVEQFSAAYYIPEDKQEDKEWSKKIPKDNYSADKVHLLYAPVGPDGASIPIAEFTYFSDHTDVRDVEHCLIRYHYTEDCLNSIEYYDKDDRLHSTLKFTWEKGNLSCKALCDADGNTLFRKMFKYDADGNVKLETFTGPDDKSQRIVKSFEYQNNLPILEQEEGGLTYTFQYQEGTDLVTQKLNYYRDSIVLREFFYYDKDNLLIRESVDDGKSPTDSDLTGITERHNKYYQRSPSNGLCLSISETYLDLNARKDHLLSRIVFTYNDNNQIREESLYDSENKKQYTLFISYDAHGHIIRKTTPSGLENLYTYDLTNGNLLYAKEVGKLHKYFEYDHAGRPIKCTETDRKSYTKITTTTYDAKGRPLTQTDPLGNTTTQVYDTFGNCTAIRFPDALDENHQSYTPIATFSHDIQGNIISHTDPLGHTTTTTYNIFRKPLDIHYPDDGRIEHSYNKNGTLKKTIHQDQSQDYFTYDMFHRIATKMTQDANQTFLCNECWRYNTFHLTSYTDAEGLETFYTYDEAGRKIKEQAKDRIITFSYDTLGRLHKTTTSGHSQVIHYNEEGNIDSQWDEDRHGTIENKMTFFYDHENRKEKAIRITSQGLSTDTFRYDPEGRLTLHTDPLDATTQFLYTEELNTLSQKVLVKTTIDPAQNITIETYDALNRLVQTKRQAPDHQTVSKEDILYDHAGNKTENRSTVYDQSTPIKTYTLRFKSDSRGRVIKEIEQNEKITSYSYDKKGRVFTKTTPNGITLTYTYDGLDRLRTCRSSDNTIHYEYKYTQGLSPTTALDKTRNLIWTRKYNIFGELISEQAPNQAKLTWDYDNAGRCILFTLPDQSTITYTYSDLHLTAVTRNTPTETYTHTYTTFDPNGHVSQEELINNLGTVTTTHDLLERPTSQSSSWNQASIHYTLSGLVEHTTSTLTSDKKYTYDPLNQLLEEGPQTYAFDSLGNPTNSKTNHLNQITSIDNTRFTYDNNGNPRTRTTPIQATTYTYDALNRLTQIASHREIQYHYDPFGRLYSKQTPTKTHFYLYNNDKEIGLLDPNHNIIELKVLGLGLQGDIGAAVAIEINSIPFAPLHDFAGNIIALLASDGSIQEQYDISAFGQETSTPTRINPWRFNSKRTEEGLIFFGLRFYDPALGRWLTPDPAGSADSANLYLYVRNSPMNRLDLFGLYSEDLFNELANPSSGIWTKVPPIYNDSSPRFKGFIAVKAIAGDIREDWVISSNLIQKLQYTPEEVQSGFANIFDHFTEMFSREGSGIGIFGMQNGVFTTQAKFNEMFANFCEKIPGTPLIIGMCNPTLGKYKDLKEAVQEMQKKETSDVIIKRQMIVMCADTIKRINPNLLCAQFDHSGAGGITCSIIESLNSVGHDLLREQFCFIGIAPSAPISWRNAKMATNFYSEKDAITGTFGKTKQNNKNYDIQFLARMPKSDGTYNNRLNEHSYLEPTLQKGLNDTINIMRVKYGIYEDKR